MRSAKPSIYKYKYKFNLYQIIRNHYNQNQKSCQSSSKSLESLFRKIIALSHFFEVLFSPLENTIVQSTAFHKIPNKLGKRCVASARVRKNDNIGQIIFQNLGVQDKRDPLVDTVQSKPTGLVKHLQSWCSSINSTSDNE